MHIKSDLQFLASNRNPQFESHRSMFERLRAQDPSAAGTMSFMLQGKNGIPLFLFIQGVKKHRISRKA
jgi:hypothetical protein